VGGKNHGFGHSVITISKEKFFVKRRLFHMSPFVPYCTGGLDRNPDEISF
jgi:hypothetical protein